VYNPYIIFDISEDKVPCSLKKPFSDNLIILNETEYKIDWSVYLAGSDIIYSANSLYNNVLFDGSIMTILGAYRNASYSIYFEAYNQNHANTIYKVTKTINVIENPLLPNIIEDGGLENYNTFDLRETTRFKLLELFIGDSLSFKCSAPGLIENENELVLKPEYRNKKYTVEVIASNFDFFGKKHSILSAITISETVRPPSLKGNGLNSIGLLRLSEFTKYINLSEYYENVKTYKYVISEKSNIDIEIDLSLKYDLLKIKQTNKNIKYKIDIIGTNIDYKGIKYDISSSFMVFDDIV